MNNGSPPKVASGELEGLNGLTQQEISNSESQIAVISSNSNDLKTILSHIDILALGGMGHDDFFGRVPTWRVSELVIGFGR